MIALYVAETIGAIAKKTSFAKALVALVMMSGVLLVQPTLRQAVRYGAICRDRIANGNEFGCMEDIFGDFLRLAQSTKGKLPENSVVISRKPTLFYLNSGYRSRMYPLYTEPDSLFTEARRIGAHYLVADNISDLAPIYLHPILTKNRDDFCVVPGLSNANAVLMKIEIGGPPRPPGTPPDVFRVCGQP